MKKTVVYKKLKIDEKKKKQYKSCCPNCRSKAGYYIVSEELKTWNGKTQDFAQKVMTKKHAVCIDCKMKFDLKKLEESDLILVC
jgi:hypothetical protein